MEVFNICFVTNFLLPFFFYTSIYLQILNKCMVAAAIILQIMLLPATVLCDSLLDCYN